jgi:hypothetical protein
MKKGIYKGKSPGYQWDNLLYFVYGEEPFQKVDSMNLESGTTHSLRVNIYVEKADIGELLVEIEDL